MPTEPAQPPNERTTMADSSEVQDHEELLRRILRRLAEYNGNLNPPLQAGAFHPTKRDIDGLSLNRRYSDAHPTFPTPEVCKNWPEVPQNIRETCGVLGIFASGVRSVGLTIEPNPATLPGHVLIPELNYNRFEGTLSTDDSRLQIIAWALQLSRLARIHISPGKSA